METNEERREEDELINILLYSVISTSPRAITPHTRRLRILNEAMDVAFNIDFTR